MTLTPSPPRQRRRRALRRRDAAAGYALLAPSLFGVAVFLLLPILVVVWLSFQRWDLLAPVRPVGLKNYTDVLGDPVFYHALGVTMLLVVIVIPVQTALGIAIASLLARGLPGSGLLRTIYVIPWICAPLALGVVWNWILAPTNGALNALTGHRVEWLSDPALALPVTAGVLVWTQVGYVTLFFLAGLLNIPEDLIEAAVLDGAGPVALFWQIKLPLLRPTLFFVLVTSVITVFQLFDQVYALTGGGPYRVEENGTFGATDVVGTHIYSAAFERYDVGQSAVMALVLLVLLVAITLAQQLYFRKRITYDPT